MSTLPFQGGMPEKAPKTNTRNSSASLEGTKETTKSSETKKYNISVQFTLISGTVILVSGFLSSMRRISSLSSSLICALSKENSKYTVNRGIVSAQGMHSPYCGYWGENLVCWEDIFLCKPSLWKEGLVGSGPSQASWSLLWGLVILFCQLTQLHMLKRQHEGSGKWVSGHFWRQHITGELQRTDFGITTCYWGQNWSWALWYKNGTTWYTEPGSQATTHRKKHPHLTFKFPAKLTDCVN